MSEGTESAPIGNSTYIRKPDMWLVTTTVRLFPVTPDFSSDTSALESTGWWSPTGHHGAPRLRKCILGNKLNTRQVREDAGAGDGFAAPAKKCMQLKDIGFLIVSRGRATPVHHHTRSAIFFIPVTAGHLYLQISLETPPTPLWVLAAHQSHACFSFC